MMRAAALLGFVAIALLAQEPNKDPDSFDIEPPLLIPNREDEQLSNPKPESAPGRDVDLAKLEKELERARKNAASATRRRLPAHSNRNRFDSSALARGPAVASRRPSPQTLPTVCRLSSQIRE